jgi:DNA helicase-2/ATP-dependent DNA helicase PcrA
MTSDNGTRYLDGLNEQQKEAVLHTEGPLLIVAGAGAGKTKTITHRIAHLIEQGVKPRAILAVTFTNKAAGEMRERVHSLLPEGIGTPLVATFHSLGVRLLREFHAEAKLPRGFTIWDRDDSVRAIKRILERMDIGEWTPRNILSAISRQKGDGVSPADFEQKANSFRQKAVAQVWRAYEEILNAEGALDFDDLLARTLTLLQKDARVLSLLQNRWQYITIDEYQDTNAAQYEIARLLAGEARNLCVVGDIDQNIYSWRGADIAHLLSFEKSFPGTKVVTLEQNYRSTRTILTAANAVIAKNVKRLEKNLFTDNPTGEPVVLYGGRNEIDEAWFIAQTAARLIEDGTPAGEIAVLYRENFQSRALEEAMLAFGVSYRVLGTRFFERKEVKDTLSYLRAAMNPKGSADIVRIIGTPPRGIGKTTLDKLLAGEEDKLPAAARAKIEKFRETLTKINHAITTLPASDAVRYCAEASGIEAMHKEDTEEGEERLNNIRELVNLAVRYDDAAPPEGIERLLEEAALQSDQDELVEKRAAVSLMTVHASKGLEFDAVFVTGLEQGLFPSIRDLPAQAGDTRDTEEERRLFYVAVTRARKLLFLTYAGQRMKYGSREFTLPSEFLEDIDQRLMTILSRESSDTMHGGLID